MSESKSQMITNENKLKIVLMQSLNMVAHQRGLKFPAPKSSRFPGYGDNIPKKFRAKWKDVKDMKTARTFLQPQDYTKLVTIEPDSEEHSFFYNKDGYAATGTGNDYWIDAEKTEAYVNWCMEQVKKWMKKHRTVMRPYSFYFDLLAK
jgi:hypothetical protein